MKFLYGYVAAGAVIGLALASGVGYYYGTQHATARGDLAMERHLADALRADAAHKQKVEEIERALAHSQVAISEAYEHGKRDAESAGAAVVADLRAGSLRLQQRWSGCEAQRLSSTASTPSEPDATARDREESAGRIIRAAAQCDAQVRGLQALLIRERELMDRR